MTLEGSQMATSSKRLPTLTLKSGNGTDNIIVVLLQQKAIVKVISVAQIYHRNV